MKNRLFTSIVYVTVWLALFALKWLVPDDWGALGFDVLFCAVAIMGAREFLRAMDRTSGKKISHPQRSFTVAFCALTVPLYVILELITGQGFLAVICAFCIYVVFLACASVFDHAHSTVHGLVVCIFCMMYCGVLATVLSAINHLAQNSVAALLVLFLCTVFTDTGAFLIGSSLKRLLPAKLAPQLSPNKTVIGAVGGIVGGIVGALLAFVLIYYFGGLNGTVVFVGVENVYLTFSSSVIHPVVSFTLAGVAASVTAQIGDLFESAIKRECGIKDMGKCLPGHGGVLDRFDSMLFSGVIVFLAFGMIII